MKRIVRDDISNMMQDPMFNLFIDKIDKNYDGPQVISTLMRDSHEVLDATNDYHINSSGYRSKEFQKNTTDIVAAGCSISFGMGVPEDGVWPNMLGSSTGMSVANLSIPGNSTIMLVKRIMKYCDEYGDPKFIFCLFPDFFRFLFVTDEDFHKTNRSNFNDKRNKVRLRNIHSDAVLHADCSIIEPAMVIKTPFSIEENISPYYGVFQAINSIFFLESYCKAKGIKLVWTTWNNTSSSVMDKLFNYNNFELKNYVKIKELEETTTHPNMMVEKCDLHNNDKMINHPAWPIGTDLPKNNFIHPGIHFHRHIEDFFKSQMEH